MSDASKVVTLEELRVLPCAECGKVNCSEDDLVLVGQCHRHSGVIVTLNRATGLLVLTCKKCEKHIVTLQIERPSPERLT